MNEFFMTDSGDGRRLHPFAMEHVNQVAQLLLPLLHSLNTNVGRDKRSEIVASYVLSALAGTVKRTDAEKTTAKVFSYDDCTGLIPLFIRFLTPVSLTKDYVTYSVRRVRKALWLLCDLLSSNEVPGQKVAKYCLQTGVRMAVIASSWWLQSLSASLGPGLQALNLFLDAHLLYDQPSAAAATVNDDARL